MSPGTGSRRITFGQCTLDLDTRQLFVKGREVHITPKAFELLTLLSERAPKALTKNEIIEHLWPDTYVSEDALARLVADVRSALGDSARLPRWIRTVHGFGYAFMPDARASVPPPTPTSCTLTWGSREFRLREGDNVIGRDASAEILIDSQVVSRRHARITLAGGIARVEDLGSKNGTSVSGQLIEGSRQLDNGDIITVGDFEFRFHMSTDMPTVTRQP
jgi:DNA-binding winged helix-turn-helix (wHTH) protein